MRATRRDAGDDKCSYPLLARASCTPLLPRSQVPTSCTPPLPRSQVLTSTNGTYALSDTKQRFGLILNISYSALIASGSQGAFTTDLRDATALAYQVGAQTRPPSAQ